MPARRLPRPAPVLALLLIGLAAAPLDGAATPAGPHPDVQALMEKADLAAKAFRHQESLHILGQALERARSLRDRRGEASALTGMGDGYLQAGQPLRALEHFLAALAIRQEIGDKRGEADILASLGDVYLQTGQSQKALEQYRLALPLFKTAGDRPGEADALVRLGTAYLQTGQPLRAQEQFLRALPIRQQTGDRRGEASTLINLGLVYLETGRPRMAQERLLLALPICRELGDRRAEADTLSNLGLVYLETGRPGRAIGYFLEALPLFKAAGDRRGAASTRTNLGDGYLETGRPRMALEQFLRALSVWQQIGDRRGEADTLASLGRVYSVLGRTGEARRRYEASVWLLERMREDLGGWSDAKLAFPSKYQAYYVAYIDLLLRQSRHTDAFGLSQKAKARALIDLMAAGKVDVAAAMTHEERAREAAAKQRLDRANADLVAEAARRSPDKRRIAGLREQVAGAEASLKTLRDGPYARRPDLYAKRGAKTVTLAQVTKFLPPDSAVLEYVVPPVGAGVDRVVLFCLTAEKGKPVLSVFHISLSTAELARVTEDFKRAVADASGAYIPRARELYTLLVAPAARKIAGKKRLIVCPDGALWGVPFQALLVGKTGATFLADRYEITYAYSATALEAALRAHSTPGRAKPSASALALADPDFGGPERFKESALLQVSRAETPPAAGNADRPIDAGSRRDLFGSGDGDERAGIKRLPNSKREADMVKASFPGALVLTGRDAQEGAFKKEAGKYRLLHLAGHGLFNDLSPLESSVILAAPPPPADGQMGEDGFLTAREIFDLTLSADLAVLSACDTASGQRRGGEGVVGLTWALFVAGVPAQVVSQWAVSDAGTADLMTKFYAHLKQGKPKGAALRAAGLEMRKIEKYRHPYYWAPFVLMGDWR